MSKVEKYLAQPSYRTYPKSDVSFRDFPLEKFNECIDELQEAYEDMGKSLYLYFFIVYFSLSLSLSSVSTLASKHDFESAYFSSMIQANCKFLSY